MISCRHAVAIALSVLEVEVVISRARILASHAAARVDRAAPVVDSSPVALAVFAVWAAYVALAAPVSPRELAAFPQAVLEQAASAASVARAAVQALLWLAELFVVLASAAAAFLPAFFLPARTKLRKRRPSTSLTRTFR